MSISKVKKRSVTLIWNLMGTIYAETWTKEKKEAVQCKEMLLCTFTQSLSTEWRCLYEIQKENCIFLSTNVGSADCRMRKQINVDIRGQCTHGICLRYRLFRKRILRRTCGNSRCRNHFRKWIGSSSRKRTQIDPNGFSVFRNKGF